MGIKEYLLDSNVVIDHFANRLPKNYFESLSLENILNYQISVITKIEILGYKLENISINQFIEESKIIELNKQVVDQTIELRKNYKIKMADAIIAGTALAHNFILVTNNTKDFKKLGRLELINPYSQ